VVQRHTLRKAATERTACPPTRRSPPQHLHHCLHQIATVGRDLPVGRSGISDWVVHFRRRFVVVARGAGMTFFDE
jgi:hypothetical protein